MDQFNKRNEVTRNTVLMFLGFAFLFFVGTAHATDSNKSQNIKHIKDPVNLTHTSKDRTVQAGVVQIPTNDGPKVSQKGNTTIVDRNPSSTGVGVTYKFNKD